MTDRNIYYRVAKHYDKKTKEIVVGEPIPFGTYLRLSDIPEGFQVNVKQYIVMVFYFMNEISAKSFYETTPRELPDWEWERL